MYILYKTIHIKIPAPLYIATPNFLLNFGGILPIRFTGIRFGADVLIAGVCIIGAIGIDGTNPPWHFNFI